MAQRRRVGPSIDRLRDVHDTVARTARRTANGRRTARGICGNAHGTDERTANPLTDEEMKAMAAPATLSYVAQARYEMPGLLIQSGAGFQRHDFEYGRMRERGSTGQGECLGEAEAPDTCM
eukprot:COSAG02_NODE_4780_length_4987_cov_6.396072_1_plen_121_part_00